MSGHLSYSITTDAGITQAQADELEIELSPGILTEITIAFPPGCAGLTHLQILEAKHVKYPSNPDESYAWDNRVIRIHTYHEITATNNAYTLRTWNRDNVYEHLINITFNILPKDDDTISFLSTLKSLVFG